MPAPERLAAEVAREWLGPEVVLTPIRAMNSSTWLAVAGSNRYFLKISDPADEPGLDVAAWLDSRGIRTGAPIRRTMRQGLLAALLRPVEGRPLTEADVVLVGATLGRIHRALAESPVPSGLARWPWQWLRPDRIEDGALRAAATAAIATAEALAPSLTLGILHGDPHPGAFIAAGDDVGLIDWGSALHGPLLYDVASAWMYTDERVVHAYFGAGPLTAGELELAPRLLAFRWAVQAWYFADRLARDDLTGLDDRAENVKGLDDARRGLLGPSFSTPLA